LCYSRPLYSINDYNESPEYGLLCEYSSDRAHRHAFVEAPQDKVAASCKVIPAGQYYCRQSDISQIEQAKEIFKDRLAGRDSFIAIETEAFPASLISISP